MGDHDDLVKEFLLESLENLDQLDRDLIALETDRTDRSRLDSVFRTVHTVKGTCGFFGFARLSALAHAGETLLGRLRDGTRPVTSDVVTGLLALADAVRGILDRIGQSGGEGEDDGRSRPVIDALTRLLDGTAAPPAEPPPPQELPARPENTLRVDIDLLDRLTNLVGELTLARNRIALLAGGRDDPALGRAAHGLSHITSELQEGVLKARMQPIGNVWQKFPRLVRDLGLACGKQVRLTLEGERTELDRALLDAVKDPLTHLVRNAIDHGIEPPAARTAQGKPADGRLRLRAFHENGQIVIEVGDDGAGIDPSAVRRKAVERKLIAADAADRMADRELLQLVFVPGFSTADRVTDVSGRGVGMDVVKTNVERVGGTVELESHVGRGTVTRLRIPLTLAITPALLVAHGGDRYTIPQASLVELVRLAEADPRVEYVHGVPVYRFRGRLLPLVDLGRELGAAPRPAGAAGTVVVLQAGDRQLGLVVERVLDAQEVVVKPLTTVLKGVPLFAGATILGDGRVALILDVPDLARRAKVIRDRLAPTELPAAAAADARNGETQTLLLCGLGANRRLAIPVSLVRRLEQVPASAVEITADGEVIQHQGRLLPLVRLAGLLGGPPADVTAGPLHVVVCTDGGRIAGLVVDRIFDTVEAAVGVRQAGGRPGVAGTAVIGPRATDLLDVPAILLLAGRNHD